MTQQRHNQKVCFIGGAGHSGSTLLGLILGSHPDAFYGGEMKKVRVEDHMIPAKSFCRRCGPDCPIWRDITDSPDVDIYEKLSAATGKPLIVDSTKNIEWLEEQRARLAPTSSEPFLIFLQRDGRAVVNSMMRKRPHMSAADVIAHWVDKIARTNKLFESFDGPTFKIRYEELALDPEWATRALCDFLRLPHDPAMVQYYQHEHHPISGNVGTHFLVNKAQQVDNDLVQLSRKNRYYDSHPFEIRLDLRWKEELPAEAERLFEEMAGTLNSEMRWEG